MFEEAGTDLGQLLTQKKVIAAKKANMPADVAKAIGRISGGLYVVTAQKGVSRSAMIASWVSQVGDTGASMDSFSKSFDAEKSLQRVSLL